MEDDLISINSPILLSNLEYDVQSDGASAYYSGLIYLCVPETFNSQSTLSLTVSTVPDTITLGQSGLSITPYSNGISVTGSNSLNLFNSYIAAFQNGYANEVLSTNQLSNGTRSSNTSFYMTVLSYASGSFFGEDSTYSTIPTNTGFGDVIREDNG